MKLELPYIAGFLDCDGCISIARLSLEKRYAGAVQYSARVIFYSQNLEVMHSMQETIGGRLYTAETTYRLVLASRKATDLLRQLVPFLVIKRHQAEVALQLQEHILSNPVRGQRMRDGKQGTPSEITDHRHGLYLKMRQLNQKDSRTFWGRRKQSGKPMKIKATFKPGSLREVYTEGTPPTDTVQ